MPLSSVMLVLLYGQTRIFYTMAKDGLIPSVFANVHSDAGWAGDVAGSFDLHVRVEHEQQRPA